MSHPNLSYSLNNNIRIIMTIAYPSTRRPYLLDISASNSNSQTFTVNWNVLEFDNPKNQEGHCPIEYYKQHLSYVRMATHDMKFRSLRGYLFTGWWAP